MEWHWSDFYSTCAHIHHRRPCLHRQRTVSGKHQHCTFVHTLYFQSCPPPTSPLPSGRKNTNFRWTWGPACIIHNHPAPCNAVHSMSPDETCPHMPTHAHTSTTHTHAPKQRQAVTIKHQSTFVQAVYFHS